MRIHGGFLNRFKHTWGNVIAVLFMDDWMRSSTKMRSRNIMWNVFIWDFIDTSAVDRGTIRNTTNRDRFRVGQCSNNSGLKMKKINKMYKTRKQKSFFRTRDTTKGLFLRIYNYIQKNINVNARVRLVYVWKHLSTSGRCQVLNIVSSVSSYANKLISYPISYFKPLFCTSVS